MEPFKVQIEISTPVVISRPPTLDAIIAWCAVQENGGDFSAGDKLPLQQRENNEQSYWAASRFFYEWFPAMTPHLSKRINHAKLERYSDSKIVVNPGSGINKTYHEHIMPLHINKAVAFGVGDIDEVDYLLRKMTHFGKLSRSGYGRVTNIAVEEFPNDWSENINGTLTRPIPSSIEKADCMGGFKAPYWKKENWQPVIIPSSKNPIEVRCFIN